MDDFIKTLIRGAKSCSIKSFLVVILSQKYSQKAAEEPISEARWLQKNLFQKQVDGDFTMKKSSVKPRRSIVQAGENTWTDTGEQKGILKLQK